MLVTKSNSRHDFFIIIYYIQNHVLQKLNCSLSEIHNKIIIKIRNRNLG